MREVVERAMVALRVASPSPFNDGDVRRGMVVGSLPTNLGFCSPSLGERVGVGGRNERFLAEMELIVPFPRMASAIEPFYPKGDRGCPPIGLIRLLPMYLLQP